VYRIVQEGLTNVTRHARAHSVVIGLRRQGTDLVLSVEDDGFGLGPGDTEKRSSHGLVGIRERARLLGGSAAISNPRGGGCRLEVRLPAERVDSNFNDLGETA
jgi:signal transduction histidine kinase